MKTERIHTETTDWENEGWLNCDKRGKLMLHKYKPERTKDGWGGKPGPWMYLDKGAAPYMTWKDDPRHVVVKKHCVETVTIEYIDEYDSFKDGL